VGEKQAFSQFFCGHCPQHERFHAIN